MRERLKSSSLLPRYAALFLIMFFLASNIACTKDSPSGKLFSLPLTHDPEFALQSGAICYFDDPGGPVEPWQLADAKGNIYIFDYPEREARVTVWDQTTKKTSQFFPDIIGPPFIYLFAVDAEGNIYGSKPVRTSQGDWVSEIVKYSKQGKELFRIGAKGRILVDDKVNCDEGIGVSCTSLGNDGTYFSTERGTGLPNIFFRQETGRLIVLANQVYIFDREGKLLEVKEKGSNELGKQENEVECYAHCSKSKGGGCYCGKINESSFDVYKIKAPSGGVK